MKAETFFSQISLTERELKSISARRAHYADLAMSIGNRSGPMGGSRSASSRTENEAVGLVDLTAALDAKEADYVRQVQEAETLIEKIPQAVYRQILQLHFLAGWSLKSVSDELAYNDQKSIYRALKYALREAQKILDGTQPEG